MAFNIQEFVSNGLIRNGARPTLFQVRFTIVPPGVPNATADLQFLARSAQLPASILQPIEVPYMGRKIKLAGDREFQDWTITVMNDEDFRHRNMFEAWHNKINAIVSNRQDSDPDDLLDYKVDAEVLQYGKAGPGDDSGVIRAYTFRGLWPSMVDAVNLDWEATNTISSFDITFSYDYWEPSIFHPAVQQWSGTLPPDPVASTVNPGI